MIFCHYCVVSTIENVEVEVSSDSRKLQERFSCAHVKTPDSYLQRMRIG